eukprot:COSAG04_NODE_7097_length_1192_cov_1.285453_1_plen_156_part_00
MQCGLGATAWRGARGNFPTYIQSLLVRQQWQQHPRKYAQRHPACSMMPSHSAWLPAWAAALATAAAQTYPDGTTPLWDTRGDGCRGGIEANLVDIQRWCQCDDGACDNGPPATCSVQCAKVFHPFWQVRRSPSPLPIPSPSRRGQPAGPHRSTSD